MKASHHCHVTILLALAGLILVPGNVRSAFANERPAADAGPLRYAGSDPIRLDGSGSYDPDQSGPLHYTWRQLSGPTVTLSDADTARVLISGPLVPIPGGRGQTTSSNLVQTDGPQECEFELVVSDGELTSLPATVKLIIVPAYGANTLIQENPPFDPNKPTFIFFGGGDCVTGSGNWSDGGWIRKANILSYSPYSPDISTGTRTYYRYGDMLIVFLSSVAPYYRQPIQTAGWSTGGQPAIDVGLRLNLTYKDARYAVNRVSFLDATSYCRGGAYADSITRFLGSAVDGEQCWIDNYVGQNGTAFFPGVLNVSSGLSHSDVPAWVRASATNTAFGAFNHGLVAGAYWSVLGPGKNLQLAPVRDRTTYQYRWTGTAAAGVMGFFDEATYPGSLPQPVTLGAWVNRSQATGAVDGAVLSCHVSENAVGYQLLFGSDPSRVMDFDVVSDTPTPPLAILREFPANKPWWTVRARDRYESTIYADPVLLDLTNLPSLSVQNARTGKKYGLIEHALVEAQPGDNILLEPGTYEEDIEIADTPVTLRALDPNDPAVVAATILRSRQPGTPVITFSGGGNVPCVLAGLTIQSPTVGISCRAAAPTIRRCVLQCPEGIAVEYWYGRTPRLLDCTITGRVREGGDPGLIAYWKLDETTGTLAPESEGGYNGTLVGAAAWQPVGGKMGGALQLGGNASYVTTPFVLDPATGSFTVLAWVKGGAPGQVMVSQAGGANWLLLGADGALATELMQSGRSGKPMTSSTRLTDNAWHHVGLAWDGSDRILYADGVEVARDRLTTAVPSAAGGLNLGAGAKPAPGNCWSGLLDDIRIYDRAVKP